MIRITINPDFSLKFSCAGSNAIEFQPGDAIGYCHPSDSHYLVTHIKNNTVGGYMLYRFNEPLKNSVEVNISKGNITKHARPLLQFTVGMIYT